MQNMILKDLKRGDVFESNLMTSKAGKRMVVAGDQLKAFDKNGKLENIINCRDSLGYLQAMPCNSTVIKL